MVNDNRIIRREGWQAHKKYTSAVGDLKNQLSVIAGYNKERVEAGDIGPLQTALSDARRCYDIANQYSELFEQEEAKEMRIAKTILEAAAQRVRSLENCEI